MGSSVWAFLQTPSAFPIHKTRMRSLILQARRQTRGRTQCQDSIKSRRYRAGDCNLPFLLNIVKCFLVREAKENGGISFLDREKGIVYGSRIRCVRVSVGDILQQVSSGKLKAGGKVRLTSLSQKTS